MTFTTSLKDEISKIDNSFLETQLELYGFILASGKYVDNNLILMTENASVARKVYKNIKLVINKSPKVTVRNQKRFHVKQIYMLSLPVSDNSQLTINNVKNVCKNIDSKEEKIAFLQGVFLAVGNVSNPQTSGYHLEFICNDIKFAKYIQELLVFFRLNAKIVERGYKYIVYLKSSENISDLIKYFKATNSLFFFEDIRIYRDHKNMVNRLNNCELSNQTRSIETGIKQMNNIKYLKEKDLVDLLDDKTKIVIEAREKYPESSLTELAEIITLEYNYHIGKSGVNHHFIKINKLVERHKNNNKE